MWTFKLLFWENDFQQTSHLKSFLFSWTVLTCVSKWYWQSDENSHLSHFNFPTLLSPGRLRSMSTPRKPNNNWTISKKETNFQLFLNVPSPFQPTVRTARRTGVTRWNRRSTSKRGTRARGRQGSYRSRTTCMGKKTQQIYFQYRRFDTGIWEPYSWNLPAIPLHPRPLDTPRRPSSSRWTQTPPWTRTITSSTTPEWWVNTPICAEGRVAKLNLKTFPTVNSKWYNYLYILMPKIKSRLSTSSINMTIHNPYHWKSLQVLYHPTFLVQSIPEKRFTRFLFSRFTYCAIHSF